MCGCATWLVTRCLQWGAFLCPARREPEVTLFRRHASSRRRLGRHPRHGTEGRRRCRRPRFEELQRNEWELIWHFYSTLKLLVVTKASFCKTEIVPKARISKMLSIELKARLTASYRLPHSKRVWVHSRLWSTHFWTIAKKWIKT